MCVCNICVKLYMCRCLYTDVKEPFQCGSNVYPLRKGVKDKTRCWTVKWGGRMWVEFYGLILLTLKSVAKLSLTSMVNNQIFNTQAQEMEPKLNVQLYIFQQETSLKIQEMPEAGREREKY